MDTTTVDCPYCGEQIEIAVDLSVKRQQYIEDCQVCCRPIVVNVSADNNSEALLTLFRDDE